jgi:hypothetical protein
MKLIEWIALRLRLVWRLTREDVPEAEFPGIVREGDWLAAEVRNRLVERDGFARGAPPVLASRMKAHRWWDKYGDA